MYFLDELESTTATAIRVEFVLSIIDVSLTFKPLVSQVSQPFSIKGLARPIKPAMAL